MPQVRFNALITISEGERRWVTVLAKGPDEWTIGDFEDEAQALADAIDHDIRYDRNLADPDYNGPDLVQVGGIEAD